MLTIITMPSASTLISDISSYASPFFDEFYAIVKPGLGIFFAVGAVAILIGMFIKFSHLGKQ